jgi:hypothetical protein
MVVPPKSVFNLPDYGTPEVMFGNASKVIWPAAYAELGAQLKHLGFTKSTCALQENVADQRIEIHLYAHWGSRLFHPFVSYNADALVDHYYKYDGFSKLWAASTEWFFREACAFARTHANDE